MASRKRTGPPPIEVRNLTRAEIDRGSAKLRRRIEEVRTLDPRTLPFDDAKIDTVEANIREAIRDVFGPNSPEFNDHQHHRIWHGGINSMEGRGERQAKFADGIPQTVTILEGLISRLEERREDAPPDATLGTPPRRAASGDGRDEAAKEAVARFLDKLELRPIILHEQPNKPMKLAVAYGANAVVEDRI